MLRVQDVPATQRKTASSITAKAKARAKESQRVLRLTRTVPPSLKASVAIVARKATSVQIAWKRLADPKDKKVHAVDGAASSATVAVVEDTGETDEAGLCGSWSDDDDSGVHTSEAWVLSVEGNNIPADAEFLPLDSACEEHTCPWNFPEGERDSGPSTVQLRNANGLSIPSGKK